MPGDAATTILGAAAWAGHEGRDARFMWPHMFDSVAAEYDVRYGLDETHLRAIATLNFANARANPNAQTRNWSLPEPLTDDDVQNPVIEGRLRRFDCSQITDGGAGVVLVNDDWLKEHPGVRPLGRIDGWGHRTVGLGLRQKLDRSRSDPAENMSSPTSAVPSSTPSVAHTSPSTTLTGSRYTIASRPANTSRSTTSG